MSQDKLIWLACDECKQRNKPVNFSRKKDSKLAIRKFCRYCRKHTSQTQTK